MAQRVFFPNRFRDGADAAEYERFVGESLVVYGEVIE